MKAAILEVKNVVKMTSHGQVRAGVFTFEWTWNSGRSSLWRKWLNGATIPWLEHKSICWTRGKCFVLCLEKKGEISVPCGPFFRFFLVPSSPFIALEHGGWCAFHEARRNPPRMEHLPHTGRKTFDLPTFKWRRNFQIFLRFWNNVTELQREQWGYGTMLAAFSVNIGKKSAPVWWFTCGRWRVNKMGEGNSTNFRRVFRIDHREQQPALQTATF